MDTISTRKRKLRNLRAHELLQDVPEAKRIRYMKPPPPPRKECMICTDNLLTKTFPTKIIHRSLHATNICTTCWQQHLHTEVSTKPTTQISCPQCQTPLQEPEIQLFATKSTYAAYLDKIFLETLQSDADYRVCPSATCKFGYIMTQNDDQSDSIFTAAPARRSTAYAARCPCTRGSAAKPTKQSRTAKGSERRESGLRRHF